MQLRCRSEHLPPEQSLILNFFDWFSSLCNVWDWYLWPAFSFNFLKNANSEVLGSSAACYIRMEWLIFSNTSSNYFWLVPLEIQHNYGNRACIYLTFSTKRKNIFNSRKGKQQVIPRTQGICSSKKEKQCMGSSRNLHLGLCISHSNT